VRGRVLEEMVGYEPALEVPPDLETDLALMVSWGSIESRADLVTIYVPGYAILCFQGEGGKGIVSGQHIRALPLAVEDRN
jgi:hypothetical protein